MFPNSAPFDFSLAQHLAGCHKETQTSRPSLKDSSTGTLSEHDVSNNDSTKIIEVTELVHDPKHPSDITIIKDVFSEEIHDHSRSPSDEASSHRFTYCREVIKPFIKDYPNDCPVSDDQLIKDALEAAHQEFPDYKSCLEISDGNKHIDKKDSINNGNLDKRIKDSSVTDSASSGKLPKCHKPCVPCKKKSPNTSNTSILDKNNNLESSKTSIIKKEKKSNTSLPDATPPQKPHKTCTKTCKKKSRDTSKTSIKSKDSSNSSLTSNMDENDDCPKKKRDRRCPKESDCPKSVEIGICAAQKGGPKPGPPSACKNRSEAGSTNTCKNNPSVESCKEEQNKKKKEETSTSKKKDDSPCGHTSEMSESELNSKTSLLNLTPSTPSVENPKTMADAHSETLTTIKSAVEDFIGKVYKTTKDAVTLIKSESARHLSKITTKKSGTACESLPPLKVHDNKNPDGVTSYSVFKSINDDEKADNNDANGTISSVEKAWGKLLTKVDSTVSMLSGHVNLDKVASLMRVKDLSDTSSQYDKTSSSTPSSPKSSNAGNSVFTVIKSKIVSIFGEGEIKENKVITASGSSDTITADEEEDDENLHPYR